MEVWLKTPSPLKLPNVTHHEYILAINDPLSTEFYDTYVQLLGASFLTFVWSMYNITLRITIMSPISLQVLLHVRCLT